jgi:hypothetical protein
MLFSSASDLTCWALALWLDLYKAGYIHQINIDISTVVIKEMRAQNQQYIVPGKLDCMQCLSLPQADPCISRADGREEAKVCGRKLRLGSGEGDSGCSGVWARWVSLAPHAEEMAGVVRRAIEPCFWLRRRQRACFA